MVLQQAEADGKWCPNFLLHFFDSCHVGYSVFAVTQANPSTPPALPHTEADDLGSTLPEPHSASRPNLSSFISHNSGGGPSGAQPVAIEGMEDEDYELQAALQASLMGDMSHDHPPPVFHHSVPLPPSENEATSSSSESIPPDVPSDLDPVAATMERNRLLLERMKAEQAFAQRQLWADGENEGVREHDAEEEMIRRAIEESEASARLEGHGAPEVSPEADMGDSMQSHSVSRYAQDRVYDDDDALLRKKIP